MNLTAHRVDLKTGKIETRFVQWSRNLISWTVKDKHFHEHEYEPGHHIWFDNEVDANNYAKDWVSKGERK